MTHEGWADMGKSKVAIAVIWVVIIGGAMWEGASLPSSRIVELYSPRTTPPIILVVFFAFSVVGTFSQRHKGFDVGFLSSLFDSRYGQGTTSRFLKLLKPVALIMVAALALGASGLISAYQSTKELGAYVLSGFPMAVGLGILVAYLLSIGFPPRLN